MLKQSVHSKIVQGRPGNTLVSITLDTYSHVAPGKKQAAAKAFDVRLAIEHNNEVGEKAR